MKYDIFYGTKFKKDLKLAKKQGMDLQLIRDVIDMLEVGTVLPEQYKDHNLVGNSKGYRECHILSDWLLIYSKDENVRLVSLYRTGSHAELFGK